MLPNGQALPAKRQLPGEALLFISRYSVSVVLLSTIITRSQRMGTVFEA